MAKFKNTSTSFLKILVIVFASAFCLTEVAVAQSHEQRLIPLFFSDFPGPYTDTHFSDFEVDDRVSNQNRQSEFDDLIRGREADIILGTSKSDGAFDDRFVVYGRALDPKHGGIENAYVEYRYIPYADLREDLSQPNFPEPDLRRLPDLEGFFDFGGTLELLTTDFSLKKSDIIISELLWGLDIDLKDDEEGPKGGLLAQLNSQHAQWIELYNTTDRTIDIAYDTAHSTGGAELYLLFTPFVSYPERETVRFNGETYQVLDAVSNLLFGRWELPGKSGKRPTSSFVSAYRDIDYDVVENQSLSRDVQLAGIPFGSYEGSWEGTPNEGRRNTEIRIIDHGEQLEELPYIATPGTRHVAEVYIKSLKSTAVSSNSVVINEVRNDTSRANVDWIELKNVGTRTVELERWELSIVTGVGEDADLVDLPAHQLGRGEILLILNDHPHFTDLAEGINIEEPEEHRLPRGLTHKYFVSEDLDLPDNKKFLLLLRSANNENGKDRAIADYAGNGFFTDDLTTQFWPRLAQQRPINVADFGDDSFASPDQAWARIRYQKDDGHHKDAWAIVESQGGIGYAAGVDLKYAPGTPGYENTALKTRLDDNISPVLDDEFKEGEISISEIMYDPGPNWNHVQWIELYNSSMTQAVNLKGWELEIRNFEDEERTYVDGSFEFDDATILPNQTLLLVSERAATNLSSNRVYALYRNHRQELGLARWPHLLLSPTAFYLKLTDKADPDLDGDDIIVDEIGNLKVEPGKRSKIWDLPKVNPVRRRSLVRLYGGLFKPEKDGLDGKPSPPDRGITAEGWHRFTAMGVSFSFYGVRDDLASPGYRLGGPLPVELSSFRPVRIETGEVLIRWRTASELNNAGFNILRSERRDSGFTLINVKGIIPGHGTSSEQHLYSHTDTTAKSNVIYYYRIEDVSFEGTRQTLATVRLKGEISAVSRHITMWGNLKRQE